MTCTHCGADKARVHKTFATDKPLCEPCKDDAFRAEGCRVCGRDTLTTQMSCREVDRMLDEALATAPKDAAAEVARVLQDRSDGKRDPKALNTMAKLTVEAAHKLGVDPKDMPLMEAIKLAVQRGLAHDLFTSDLHSAPSMLSRITTHVPEVLDEKFTPESIDAAIKALIEEASPHAFPFRDGSPTFMAGHDVVRAGSGEMVSVPRCIDPNHDKDMLFFTMGAGEHSGMVGCVCEGCGRRTYLVWNWEA